MTAADQARETNASDAETRTAEARDAILQLWQARSSWPTGWPPPHAAKLAATLDALPDPETERWYRHTVLGSLHDIHHRILATLVDLVSDGSPDVEQDWLDRFGQQLTAEESALFQYAAHLPQRTAALQSSAGSRASADARSKETDEPANGAVAAINLLTKLADAYRATITHVVGSSIDAAISPDAAEPDSDVGGGGSA